MKSIYTIVCILLCVVTFGQEVELSAAAYQQKLDADYKNPEKSPLEKADLAHFEGLHFFAIDSTFIVTAKLIRTPNEKPFKMATTTDRQPSYRKYGELHFTILGKALQLNVYQNAEPLSKMRSTSLFLPFTDNTSGDESYGGGRYIDLELPEGDSVLIDFNKSYNPYCAYNKAYSCPLVPAENHLDIAIRAGVKKFDH